MENCGIRSRQNDGAELIDVPNCRSETGSYSLGACAEDNEVGADERYPCHLTNVTFRRSEVKRIPREGLSSGINVMPL